jgi:hypothetical protein
LKKSFCCFFVFVYNYLSQCNISGVHRVYVVYIHGFGVQQTHQSSLVFTEHVVYMGLGATDDSFLDTPFSITLHLVSFSVWSGEVGDECLFFSLYTYYVSSVRSNNLHASRFFLQAWFITYFRIHAWDIIGSFLHIYVSFIVCVFPYPELEHYPRSTLCSSQDE